MSEKLCGTPFTKTILVWGWYHKKNLGDDLFMEAFKKMFPHHHLIFVDKITLSNLKNVDAVFIGGGSFLDSPLNIDDPKAFAYLKQKKIFYLGIGAETEIDDTHHELMSVAELIAIRSPNSLEKVQKINDKVMVIPDLVYYLNSSISEFKRPKSVLFIPNMTVVPQWNEPHWKHISWEYFRDECAQFFDELLDNNYMVNFLPLCTSHRLDDRNAAVEIINRMLWRTNKLLLEKRNDIKDITNLISQYNVVITQRYHGIILAHMAQVPCISIYHHDKLKNNSCLEIPYFGISKSHFREQLKKALKTKTSEVLPIDRNIFEELIRKVDDALCRN